MTIFLGIFEEWEFFGLTRKETTKKGSALAFECHASALGFYSIASWEQIKRFVGGSDITESLFL